MTDPAAREIAINAAYRDRLAFWYPDRAPARIAYKERAQADGAWFDVVRITPEGGRPFELWINTETKLIERMEADGLVSAADHVGRRQVLMGRGGVDGNEPTDF